MNRLWVAMVFIERSGTLNSTFQCQFVDAHHAIASVFLSQTELFLKSSMPFQIPVQVHVLCKGTKSNYRNLLLKKEWSFCTVVSCLAWQHLYIFPGNDKAEKIWFNFGFQFNFCSTQKDPRIKFPCFTRISFAWYNLESMKTSFGFALSHILQIKLDKFHLLHHSGYSSRQHIIRS